MYKFILILIFTVFTNFAYSQQWHEPNGTSNSNFFEQRDQFIKEFGNKDITAKGSGWKPFKRWEWFWEPRVGKDGNFPNSYETFRVTQKARKPELKSKDKVSANYPWFLIDPYVNTDAFQGTGRINVVKTNPNNTQDVYVGAAGGGLWISHDAGLNWMTTTDELGSIGVSDVVIDNSNSNIIYIATGDRDHSDTRSIGVMKSVDAGGTWSATGLVFNTTSGYLIHKLLMYPGNSNVLYAATSNGIYITTDAGNTWNRTFTSTCGDLIFNPTDPQIMYMVNSTRIYKSVNAGYTWTQVTNGLPTTSIQRIKLAVTPANGSYVYAIYSNSSSGYLGTYRSTDNGDTWTTRSTTPNILGWSNTGSDTGGQGWYDLAIAGSQVNADILYIGGINVWYSTNGGTNWTFFNTNMHVDIHDLYFVPGTDILYCGNDGGVYRKNAGQTTWNWLGASLATTQYYSLGTAESTAGNVIGGAQDNGTKLHTSTTVKMVYGGDGMECAIDPTNSNYVYACYQNGGLGRSTNGGSSFTNISPSTTGQWVTPYVLNPQKSSTIFAGYSNIYKSTNRGTNWTTVSNFGTSSGMNFLHVAPSDSNYIYTGRYSGFFKKTTNGGTTWTDVAYPSSSSLTYIAISNDDPNKIWVSNSGYTSTAKVFYSSNGGTNWTNLSTGLPNVPCNTIVYQKNSPNRVFVGTDIGVWYRDDYSNGWMEYNTNFPNVVVDELEINYNSKKLFAATFGRGIWSVSLPDTRLNPLLTGNDSVCCKSIQVYHTNYNPNLSYQWMITNGTILGSSTRDSVIVQWNIQNTGTLKIAQFDINLNVRDTTERTFTLYSLPSPTISGENVVCCGDTVKYYINQELGAIYKWQITNGKAIGSTSNSSVNVLWSDSCSNTNFDKKIKLIQTNQYGCTDSTSIDIVINPLPIATIKGNLTVCENHETIYKTDPNDEYIFTWTAKGGKIRKISDDMIGVTWDNTTSGQVDLLIQNSVTGCSFKTSKSVVKEKAATMTINGLKTACINESLVFSTANESNYNNSWSSKKGKYSPVEPFNASFTWDKSGKDTVTLIKTNIYNACSDTTFIIVDINTPPDVKIAGTENTYRKTSSTYSTLLAANEVISWKVENGTVISSTSNSINVLWGKFNSGTIYLYKVNTQTNCADSNKLAVTLTDYFIPKITGENYICLGDTADYVNNVVNYNTSWIVTNGKIISQSKDKIKILWDKSGNGEITLIVSNNSVNYIDTLVFLCTVQPLPAKPTITMKGNSITSSANTGNNWFFVGSDIIISKDKICYPKEDGSIYVVVIDSVTGCYSISDPVKFSHYSDLKEYATLIKILPNPNNGSFSVELPNELNSLNLRFEVCDLLGKNVLKTDKLFNNQMIELKNLSGVYILRIYENDKIIHQEKLIIY